MGNEDLNWRIEKILNSKFFRSFTIGFFKEGKSAF